MFVGVTVMVGVVWGYIRAVGSQHRYRCYCEECCSVGVTVLVAVGGGISEQLVHSIDIVVTVRSVVVLVLL